MSPPQMKEEQRMKKVSSNNNKKEEKKPSKFQIWKLASRPHTLTASIVPVIVGYALTYG